MTHNETIPTHDLMHNNEKVFFAFRTIEENHIKLGNIPDVPHRHDFYTIILVKNTSGQHFIDFKEYPITPGMLFFVGPGQVHQVITKNSNPTGDILMFNCEFLFRNYISEEFIRNIGLFSDLEGTPPLYPDINGFKILENLSTSIRIAFAENSVYKFEIIGSYLKLFLIECNKYAVAPQSTNLQTLQAGKSILKDFRHLLNENFTKWHKVQEYAGQLYTSPDYLNSVVKSITGKTAKELILQRIIVEAKRMGLHTELSTKEIAFNLGFDDPTHFSKLFRRLESHTFSDFRLQLEKSLVA